MCAVQPDVIVTLCVCGQFGGKALRQEDQTAESVKNQMTVEEWEKVFEMTQDKNLYHNLCTSLFPTIHGNPAPHSFRSIFCYAHLMTPAGSILVLCSQSVNIY